MTWVAGNPKIEEEIRLKKVSVPEPGTSTERKTLIKSYPEITFGNRIMESMCLKPVVAGSNFHFHRHGKRHG